MENVSKNSKLNNLINSIKAFYKKVSIYYKKHDVYDFPQKKRGRMMVMCFLGAMVRNKKIKQKMGNKFNEGMIAPYQKVLKKIK